MGAVRVLVVDDSALVRQILSTGLSRETDIEVVGAAADVYQARDMIVRLEPDVLTLDVEMPRMDGVEFLKRLMPQKPLPVVMVSAMTGPGARVTLEALDNGAVDFVLKPSSSFGGKGLEETISELAAKIRTARSIDVSYWRKRNFRLESVKPGRVLHGGTEKVIAMGASTGGTVALRSLLQSFPADMPGTLIVQHMPPTFTGLFAEKLNEFCEVQVLEARDGDRVLRGRVLVAPGGYHMTVERSGGQYRVRIREGEKLNGHIPSVDMLFSSVAAAAGSNALGVILTGMGGDGARGLLEMRRAGARTIGQDEESSVVYGMPHVAWEIGAVEEQQGIHGMVRRMTEVLGEMAGRG